jgi:hypothetical protein
LTYITVNATGCIVSQKKEPVNPQISPAQT